MFRVPLTALALIALCAAQEPSPLLKDGDAAFAKGDYAAAIRLFDQANQHLPPNSPGRYDILKRLTAAYAASGQFPDAAHALEQAVTWRESANKSDPKIADDLLLSVTLDVHMKQFDHALATAQRVEVMHVAAFNKESLPVAADLLRIGQIYVAAKRPDQAVRPLLTALGIRTRLANSLDPGLLPILDLMNETFARGETTFRQALVIRETMYGKDSPELINTVEAFAAYYSSQSMFEAAEPLYLRLLALWEAMAGPDHPMVAVTLDKLVVLYVKQGEPQKARDALARSVDIRALFLAVGLSHQAADETSQDHPAKARALYNRALDALGQSNQDSAEELKKALASLK